MGTFIENITIRTRRYAAKELKDYPIDKFQYMRITRLRTQIGRMRTVIKDRTDRIKVKEDFLEEIYDDLLKKLDSYNKKNEQRRRNKMSGRAFKS